MTIPQGLSASSRRGFLRGILRHTNLSMTTWFAGKSSKVIKRKSKAFMPCYLALSLDHFSLAAIVQPSSCRSLSLRYRHEFPHPRRPAAISLPTNNFLPPRRPAALTAGFTLCKCRLCPYLSTFRPAHYEEPSTLEYIQLCPARLAQQKQGHNKKSCSGYGK